MYSSITAQPGLKSPIHEDPDDDDHSACSQDQPRRIEQQHETERKQRQWNADPGDELNDTSKERISRRIGRAQQAKGAPKDHDGEHELKGLGTDINADTILNIAPDIAGNR